MKKVLVFGMSLFLIFCAKLNANDSNIFIPEENKDQYLGSTKSEYVSYLLNNFMMMKQNELDELIEKKIDNIEYHKGYIQGLRESIWWLNQSDDFFYQIQQT